MLLLWLPPISFHNLLPLVDTDEPVLTPLLFPRSRYQRPQLPGWECSYWPPLLFQQPQLAVWECSATHWHRIWPSSCVRVLIHPIHLVLVDVDAPTDALLIRSLSPASWMLSNYIIGKLWPQHTLSCGPLCGLDRVTTTFLVVSWQEIWSDNKSDRSLVASSSYFSPGSWIWQSLHPVHSIDDISPTKHFMNHHESWFMTCSLGHQCHFEIHWIKSEGF